MPRGFRYGVLRGAFRVRTERNDKMRQTTPAPLDNLLRRLRTQATAAIDDLAHGRSCHFMHRALEPSDRQNGIWLAQLERVLTPAPGVH